MKRSDGEKEPCGLGVAVLQQHLTVKGGCLDGDGPGLTLVP